MLDERPFKRQAIPPARAWPCPDDLSELLELIGKATKPALNSMFEGLGGYGELVETREQLLPAVKRAIASGKTACVNVKTVGHISPVVLAMTGRRDKASIE